VAATATALILREAGYHAEGNGRPLEDVVPGVLRANHVISYCHTRASLLYDIVLPNGRDPCGRGL